jgi:hypothetical protein
MKFGVNILSEEKYDTKSQGAGTPHSYFSLFSFEAALAVSRELLPDLEE